ncbi:hypothetical protein FM101_03170 [Arthrobacter rhombi]|uniref:Uncharacterized protein n=1 Tax=Arthrobacter rhombi TaxID=71253 RepID=A0A1R4FBA0_9MICC|nr:hypothetical protein FM101_03170 [Arthrobacter rhombi]
MGDGMVGPSLSQPNLSITEAFVQHRSGQKETVASPRGYHRFQAFTLAR